MLIVFLNVFEILHDDESWDMRTTMGRLNHTSESSSIFDIQFCAMVNLRT